MKCSFKVLLLLCVAAPAFAGVTHPGSNNIHSGNDWHTNSVGYQVGDAELYAATSQGWDSDNSVNIGNQAEAGIQYHITKDVTWYAEYSNSFGADMSSGKTTVTHLNGGSYRKVRYHYYSAGDVARYHGDVPTDGFFTGIKISW